MPTNEAGQIFLYNDGGLVILEPIESIKVILEWVRDTPDAYANVSYSPEAGWNIAAFINKEEA